MSNEDNKEEPTQVGSIKAPPQASDTVTREEARKAVSDVKAEQGRIIADLTKKLEVSEAERERAMEVIRDDSDLLSEYQERHSVKRDREKLDAGERELARDRATHQEEITEAQAIHKAATIRALAEEHGCDPTVLEELNLETVEQTEAVAKALGAIRSKPKTQAEPDFEPDSGETAGGLTGIGALEKANEDFSKGLITEKQLQEIASKVK